MYLFVFTFVGENELTGATNLIAHYNLEHSYNKFCCGRKMKDQLSAFLPNLPGNIDTLRVQDNRLVIKTINFKIMINLYLLIHLIYYSLVPFVH